MRRRRRPRRPLVVLLPLIVQCLLADPGAAQLADTVPVFEIIAYNCATHPADRRQTGFVVQGIQGLVTALHGVVGCKVINARGPVALQHLDLVAVDIPRDIAVLDSHALEAAIGSGEIRPQQRGPTPGERADVVVAGFPIALSRAYFRNLKVENPRKHLQDLVPEGDPLYGILGRRGSPDPGAVVVSLDGFLQPGHSGAPVMDVNGRVFAVGNGGIRGEGVGWAIPVDSIRVVPGTRAAQAIARLAKAEDTEDLFSFSSLDIRPAAFRPSISVGGLVSQDATDWHLRLNLPARLGAARIAWIFTTGRATNQLFQTVQTLPGVSPVRLDSTSVSYYGGVGLEYRPRPYPDRFWDPYVRLGVAQVMAGGINPRLEGALGMDFFISSRLRLLMELTATAADVPQDIYTFNRFGRPEVNSARKWVNSYGFVIGVGLAVAGIR